MNEYCDARALLYGTRHLNYIQLTLPLHRRHIIVAASQNKTSEYCAPLTSFDWNTVDPNVIGTCSIDTTCTIWDVNAKKVRVWGPLSRC